MLRVNNGVLVVPPFECAWLTGEGFTLRSGAGCISFEARGDTDVTVILKSTPGAKRLQPLLRQAAGSAQGHGGGGNALQVEQNYTIIFGSHRNSCLKIEKNGVTQCMVAGVACSRVSSKAFSKYWVDLNLGVLTIGHGEPGEGVCQQWRDTQEIPGIQHIGLSCWDRHVSYRAIALHPPLDFTRLQQQQALGGSGACSAVPSAVPSLFDVTCDAIMAATTPDNVCRTLHVAELLLPTTQKLYRYCLGYIARHFEAVAGIRQRPTAAAEAAEVTVAGAAAPAAMSQRRRSSDGGEPAGASLSSVSPAAMCDLVCQNTFSVDEQGIYSAVRDWAWSYMVSAAAAAEPPPPPGHPAGGDDKDVGGNPGGGGEAVAAGQQQQGQPPFWSLGGCSAVQTAAAAAWAPPLQPPTTRVSLDLVAPTGLTTSGLPPLGGMPDWGLASVGDGGDEGASAAAVAAASASGGSPRRLSAPLLSCTALSTALSAAVAAAAPPSATPVAATTPHGAAAITAAASGAGDRRDQVRSLASSHQPTFLSYNDNNNSCSSSAAAAAAAAMAADISCVEGVLSLIRYPLLPISQLRACLRDPLLQCLPGVLRLVREALEVHRRETGAADAVHDEPGSLGSGICGATGSLAASGLLSPTPSERRLVKPLLSPKAGMKGMDGGGGGGGMGATAVAAAGGGGGAAAADGGGAVVSDGRAGDDSRWSVRYQRRCLPFALELMYVCDGDSCGVLHFLGTQYGSQGWVNPLLAKRVDVRASSPTGRTTDPRVVAGRQFVSTNFAGPRYVNGAASSWWQVDLGEPHQLAITYYTLRHDGSPDFARSWVLQGSNDLTTWVDLKRHSQDTTIKVPGQYASWPVIGPAAAVPYRAFRLLLTAPNASPNPASRMNFCLSNIELYGFLHKGNGAAAAGGGSGGTGVGGVAAAAGPAAAAVRVESGAAVSMPVAGLAAAAVGASSA